MRLLLRSQLARQADMNLETLRFYEKIGVIPAPKRAENGYRIYPETTLLLLEFIRYAKASGFTLTEIKTLFSAVSDGSEKQKDLEQLIDKKIRQMEQKTEELQYVQRKLQEMKEHWNHPGVCPLCQYLEEIKKDS